MSHIMDAFQELVSERKQTGTWYVCLCSTQRRYGGPEEGGWWYDASELHEYAEFPSREIAEQVAGKVRLRAAELSAEDRRSRDLACARSLEWLESRGLEAGYLPEPDGHEEFFVAVTEELPTMHNEKPRYE